MTRTTLTSLVADLEARRAVLQAQLACLDRLLVDLPIALTGEPLTNGTRITPRVKAPPVRPRRPAAAPVTPRASRADAVAFEAQVLAVLQHRPAHAFTCGQIVRAITPTPSSSRVWEACQRLVRTGRLLRDGKLYRLPLTKAAPKMDVVWNGAESRAGKLLTNAPSTGRETTGAA